MDGFDRRRAAMVRDQVAGRGIDDARVLAAMHDVRRECFAEPEQRAQAFDDAPLAGDHELARPFDVARMLAAAALRGDERVLDIGAGSGYVSALLARLAARVFALEPDAQRAQRAAERLTQQGFDAVRVRHGDILHGWADEGPYDVIVVQQPCRTVPQALREQLAVGGRLLIAVGRDDTAPELVRVTRVSTHDWRHDDVADVRLPRAAAPQGAPPRDGGLIAALARHAEPFTDIETVDLEPLLRRIGDAHLVLIGEASHGSAEFYRMRQRITQALIEHRGFSVLAVEGDWPDCASVDAQLRFDAPPAADAFTRFPQWLWRNAEFDRFVGWLRRCNAAREPVQRVAFYGLDLYSMYASITRVLDYLDGVDPQAAELARRRYGCLMPWQDDPAAYARASMRLQARHCEEPVEAMLRAFTQSHARYAAIDDGARYFDSLANARLVRDAERYYRTLFYGSRQAWNLRDTHMFETLRALLQFHGAGTKAVVWAHNAHVGDAHATEMAQRGEHNLGSLCRQTWGAGCYAIGFGTAHGSVTAAPAWGHAAQAMTLRAPLAHSYEHAFADTGVERMLLPLRGAAPQAVPAPRLQRAIGAVYRPQNERLSHYFEALLPVQFDEYVWFARSGALAPSGDAAADAGQ